jgi:hypothetical protein
MRFSFLLLAALLISQPQALAQESPSCESKTKESSGKTTITCDNQPVDVLEQPTVNIVHAVAALSRTGNNANALSLVTGSATSHFTEIDTATALIDGNRHKFKASYTNGHKKAGIAIEQVVVVLPSEYTTAIREADTFWIELNTAVFNMSPTIAQMQRIHEMRKKAESSP